MIFGIFTLLTALTIAGVAAWFSIEGLMAIFSASAISIAIMAGALEVGKLVAASWLYRYWNETKFLMKTYMTVAVLVLMLITSMGIFGYLSKAHLDQAAEGGNNNLQIARIEAQITREEKAIADAEVVISQLDQAVQTLMDYDRIRGDEGAIAVRQSQAGEREQLKSVIDGSLANIAKLQDELLPLKEKELQVELKVGPLKYVAQLIYGESAESELDKAVRLFILLLVFVFDPLAVVMVIAANQTLLRYGIDLESAGPSTTPPSKQPDPLPPNPDGIAVDDAAIAMMESAAEKKRNHKPTQEATTLNESRPTSITQTTETQTGNTPHATDELEKLREQNRSLQASLAAEQSRPPRIEEKIVEVVKEVPVQDDEKIQELAAEVERLLEELDTAKKSNTQTQEQKQDDVRRKIGFWAQPLPKTDHNTENKTYITKPKGNK